MLAIRNRYPDLMDHEKKQKGQVQAVFSPAACQVVIPPELDGRAAAVYLEYLNLFCDLVDAAQAQAGDDLRSTQAVFQQYLKTLVDHDPGVKVWQVLFGRQGGIERSFDMHFGL
jgi:hypothetical protein